MSNIAIFGGSFNPPTNAHKMIIESVLKNTKVDKIIILPSGERDDKDHGISLEQRKDMIEIFRTKLKDIGMNIELDNYFLEGQNLGYTTTDKEEQYFKEKIGFSPYFIFGSDILPDMPEWTGNINKFIEKKLKKIFIKRSGYEFNPEKYGIENFIFLNDTVIPNISSTEIREKVKKGKNISKYTIPEIIYYIEKNKVYLKPFK